MEKCSNPNSRIKCHAKCDRVVCLMTPAEFMSVGEFYADFEQLADEQVVEFLKQSKVERHA